MSYKGNEYSFQIGAEIKADIKTLKKELDGLIKQIDSKAEGTFILNADEAKKTLNNISETISKIKNSAENGTRINIESSKAKKEVEEIYAIIQDVAKMNMGNNTGIVKDSVRLQSALESASASIEKMKKTKLSEIWQTKDLETGKLKAMLDENGKAMTLYDKVISNSGSNLAKVESAIEILNRGLKSGKLELATFREEMDNLAKLKLALAEGDEAFNINNVANAKTSTIDKSDQVMLYKEYNNLKREENSLTERSVKLSAEKNQAEISAINTQLEAIRKRKAEIDSELVSRKLVGKFFEKDMSNLDQKGKVVLADTTAKEFDNLNSILDTQNNKLLQAQANIEKYLLNYKNLAPQARQELEKLKQDIEKQIADNSGSQKSTVNTGILSEEKEIAQQSHNANLQVLQDKNTQVEVSRLLLSIVDQTTKSLQLENSVITESTTATQKKAQLIATINGLLSDSQKYQTTFINEDDKNKAAKITEEIKKIKSELSSINTDNLSVEELVKVQNQIEKGSNSIKNFSKELSNLSKNNLRIKAEIDFDSAMKDTRNKAKEMADRISKEVNQLQGFKITNAYGNTAEIDAVIEKYKLLMLEEQALQNQPITNKSELIDYNASLSSISERYKEIKLSASSLNIDASINKSFTKMVDDANSVVMKTREMEEAMRKAMSQYGNIDNNKMQQLLSTIMQVRTEAEKTANTKFENFNASTSTNALKNMNNQLKEVSLSFTQLKNDAQSWDRAMGQFFDVGKIMGFTAQFSYLRRAISMVTQEVQMLDTAMTTLRITVDGTEKDFKSMTSAAADMAQEMGSSYSKTLDLLQTYANATESMESIMAKIKPTVAFSNISGMSGTETVNNIQAIMQQFKLIEKEGGNVEAATYRVTDAITSISKSLQMDFADGIKEISDGIKVSGSVMEQTGVSMETYAAMLSGVIENTRLAGNVVGNAFKTIASRIVKVENPDATEQASEDISKLEGAYKSIGIEIRKSATEFKDLDEILGELSEKWNTTMSDADKSYISYLSAGTRQTNIFQALMENMSRVNELQNEAEKGTGATLKANEEYMNSYTGKLNTLKGAWQEFASSLVESGSIKTFMTALTKLVEGLNAMSGIIAPLVSMSIPLLIGGFINTTLGAINTEKSIVELMTKTMGLDGVFKKAVVGINAFKTSLATTGTTAKGVTTAIGAANTAMKSTTVATAAGAAGVKGFAGAIASAQTAVSAFAGAIGIAFALLPLIKAGIEKINPPIETLQDNISEVRKGLDEFKDTLTGFEEAGDKIESALKSLEKFNSVSEMPVEQVEEYKSTIEDLKTLYPELTKSWGSYSEIKKSDLAELNEKLKEQLELEEMQLMFQTQGKSGEVQDSVNKADDIYSKIEKEYKRLNTLENALEEQKKKKAEYEAIGDMHWVSSYEEAIERTTKSIADRNSKINEYITKAQAFESEILSYIKVAEQLNEKGYEIPVPEYTKMSDRDIVQNILGDIKEETELEVEVEIDAKINMRDDLSSYIENFASELGESQLEIDIDVKASAFDEAKAKADDLRDSIQKIVNAQDELNQTGKIEFDTLNDIADTYPAILNYVNDRAGMQNYLTELLDAEKQSYEEQWSLMEQYNIAKNAYDEQFYQNKILNLQEVSNFEAALNELFVNNQGAAFQVNAKDANNWAEFRYQIYDNIAKWINTVSNLEAGAIEQAGTLLELLSAMDGLGGIDVPINSPIKLQRPSIPKSTYKAPTTSKKSSSKKTEKEVADLKLKINLYYKWEKAIKDVEHQMSKLDLIIESGTGKQKVAAIKKQIELYKELEKQQKALYNAQKKELANLQKQISNKGFRVEANGTVANYTAKLQELEKWANKAKGEEKEKRKEEVNAIKELLDSYTDLVDKMNDTELDILGIEGDIKDKQQELKDYYKDLMDTVSDVESQITDMIKSELEKRKEAMVKAYEKEIELLNKAKEAYQKQNEEEDYQEEHDKQKQKIAELQNAINIAMRDTSLAGKKQLAQLQEQMKEAMEELAQMEKDKNRQDQENWFDEEMSKLEEEQAKKEEEWDEKYDDKYIAELVKDIIGQGFTTIEGQVVDLTSLMTDNFTDGIGLIGDALQSEFLDKLEEAKEIASNLNNIFKEIGVNLNPRDSLTSGVSSALNSAVKTASLNMSGEINSYLRNGVNATPYQNGNSMSIGSLLQVNGNVDRAVLPNIEDMINKAVEKMQSSMKKQFRLGTGRI